MKPLEDHLVRGEGQNKQLLYIKELQLYIHCIQLNRIFIAYTIVLALS